MNTINAVSYPTTKLSCELESLRDHRDPRVSKSVVKRQIRRQMRQRLNAELRSQVESMFAEAVGAAKIRRKYDRWSDDMVKLFDYDPKSSQQAAVSATAGARVVREVQVIRKVTVSQFARKQIQVAVLAA